MMISLVAQEQDIVGKKNLGGDAIELLGLDGHEVSVRLLQSRVYLLGRAKEKLDLSPLPIGSFLIDFADVVDPYIVVGVEIKVGGEAFRGRGVAKRNPIDKPWMARGATLALYRAIRIALVRYKAQNPPF